MDFDTGIRPPDSSARNSRQALAEAGNAGLLGLLASGPRRVALQHTMPAHVGMSPDPNDLSARAVGVTIEPLPSRQVSGASGAMIAPHNDADLLAQTQRGEDAAFTQLVERYRAPLVRFCQRYLNDHDRSQDAAQVACTRAWLKITECRGEFRPWLFGIARNHTLDELKKPDHRLRVPFPDDDAPTTIASSPEPLEETITRRQDLVAAIERLPPHYRAIVELRLAGESFATIAKRLHIRPATARKRFERAKMVLRILLALDESSDSAEKRRE